MLTIHTFGSPVLRRKATPIDPIDESTRKLIDEMFESMYAAEGIGLAAPQIGESVRLFIIDISPLEADEGKRVYLNPQIIEFGDSKDEHDEGCLSLPTIRESVTRPSSVRIQYQTIEGEPVDEWVDGFLARVIQHEYDHLEGVMFIDHLSALKRSLLKKTLSRIASGEIEVENSENFEL